MFKQLAVYNLRLYIFENVI